MNDLLNSVDQRTKLAGTNRMELLIFYLNSGQPYGINVFKIKEILQSIKIRKVPHASQMVNGIASIRGHTIPLLDLSYALEGTRHENLESAPVVVTEYNRTTQGFFVRKVDRIINVDWEDVHVPPSGIGKDHYLVAVTEYESQNIQLVDVEKVLYEACPVDCEISSEIKANMGEFSDEIKIFICDDSNMARSQIKRVLGAVQENLNITTFKNGREAFNFFSKQIEEGSGFDPKKSVLISDIEMPEMDGYKLTTELRKLNEFDDMYIMLHSSLSGVFNDNLVSQVGANAFIPKFDPNDIAKALSEYIAAKN